METFNFNGISCQVVRQNRRRVRIAFHGGLLRVTLPRNLDPLPIMDRHRQWILKKHEWFRKQQLLADQLELVSRQNDEFLDLVRDASRRFAATLGVQPAAIVFRKMKSKWGSCGMNGRIRLNTWLQVLPDELIVFVVYHELAHLRVHNHGLEFKALIREAFPDCRDLDKRLRLYSLKIL
jgi:predicted metal-dependent hydrolase